MNVLDASVLITLIALPMLWAGFMIWLCAARCALCGAPLPRHRKGCYYS